MRVALAEVYLIRLLVYSRKISRGAHLRGIDSILLSNAWIFQRPDQTLSKIHLNCMTHIQCASELTQVAPQETASSYADPLQETLTL